MNDLVAVYGSLRKTGRFHLALEPYTEFMGYGFTREKYAMYDKYFPMVIANEPLTKIKVEVYKMTDSDLIYSLDRIEGHPLLYIRKKIIVDIIGEKDGRLAWLYFYNGEAHGTLIESGDYMG